MRRSHLKIAPDATLTPDGTEVRSIIERRPSGRFRLIVYLGSHPITGKSIRWTYMFDTEREAIIFRDTLLKEPARLQAKVRRQLQIDALPSPPGFPERHLYLIRGQHVMMDSDVAQMFGTRTGLLNQAVSRNRQRFPDDFAFRLTSGEVDHLRSLGVVKRPGQGGRRSFPRVFTDLGLLMVAAILKSPMAVKLNIEVVRTVNAASQTLELATPTEDE